MEEKNPEDIVTFDVPLFIRLLEFAREDATDDQTLHKVTENIIAMCQDGQVLTMDQYDQIVNVQPEVDTSNMNAIDEINLNRWAKLAGIITEEEDEDEEEFDLAEAFANSPEYAPYNDVLSIFESYESSSDSKDAQIVSDFKGTFEFLEDISKQDYYEFAMKFVDDMSEVAFIQANWISIWDDDIYEKAGLV